MQFCFGAIAIIVLGKPLVIILFVLSESHIVVVVHFRVMTIFVSVASINLLIYNPFYGKLFP